MKLTQKIPIKFSIIIFFLISSLLIFLILTLNYVFNIQYQPNAKSFLYVPITQAPKTLILELDQPDDDSLVFDDSILISGQTLPQKDILIFSDSQNLLLKSKKDGSFSTILRLDEGINKITVAVFDSQGESKKQEKTVYYSKEKI